MSIPKSKLFDDAMEALNKAKEAVYNLQTQNQSEFDSADDEEQTEEWQTSIEELEEIVDDLDELSGKLGDL